MEKLYERIQHSIDYFEKGSMTAFAKKAGISQATLFRNMKEKDEKLLMNLTGWILRAFPAINSSWLLDGKGEMLKKEGSDVMDLNLLAEVVEAFEEVLIELEKNLTPSQRAQAVCKLYEYFKLKDASQRRPAKILYFIKEASA